jgi:hypothetical protein
MRWLLAAAMLAAAGCARKAQAPPAALAPLSSAVEAIQTAPACRSTVADEWTHGWPVPDLPTHGRRFKLFFFPITGVPSSKLKVWTPAAEATLDLEHPGSPSCSVLPSAPKLLSNRRWGRDADGLTYQEFDRRKALLLQRTEEVAGFYSAGSGDPAVIREFSVLFKTMAEPDLLPYYRRLNPAFWDWVKKNGG